MKKQIIILTILFVLMMGCTLKRTNPLDPTTHNINVPDDISNILITHSPAHASNYWVHLEWDKLATENTSGYYIYRGQSYNGTYQRIQDVVNLPNTIGTPVPMTCDDTEVVPGDYFYKISAYKIQPGSALRLEGHISPYVYTRVPQ